MCRLMIGVSLLALMLAVNGTPAAGHVRVLSAVGMRQALLELEPKFERASGHSVEASFESSGVIARRIEAGENVDVVLINQAGLDRLSKAGSISSGSSAKVATSIVGVAVRAGASPPDISTAAAFRRSMLAARMVAYPDPALDGSSGVHIASVFERLGLTTTMKSKTLYADPPRPGASTPGSLVADGRADVALHQMQELIAVRGITIAGPLPNDLQQTFEFSAAITNRADDAVAARAFIEFLQSLESQIVLVAKGMGLPVRVGR